MPLRFWRRFYLSSAANDSASSCWRLASRVEARRAFSRAQHSEQQFLRRNVVVFHVELLRWKPTELEELAQLALRCVAFEPQRRPLFKDIVEALRPRTRELRTPRRHNETLTETFMLSNCQRSSKKHVAGTVKSKANSNSSDVLPMVFNGFNMFQLSILK